MSSDEETLPLTPYPTLCNSNQKKYVPTPKLSERKRALFSNSGDYKPDDKVITSNLEAILDKIETLSDTSLDGLEFHNNQPDTLLAKSNLLKNSSFLSNIENINDDSLLSADSSNDFEIPVQKVITDQPELYDYILEDSELNSNFHNDFVSPKAYQTTLDNISNDLLSTDFLTQSIDASNVDNNQFAIDFDAVSSSNLNKGNSYFVKRNSNDSIDSNMIIPETPPKKNTPKTPYETLNTDLELPRIINRKSLLTIFKTSDNLVTNQDNLNEKYIDAGVANINTEPVITSDCKSLNVTLTTNVLKRKLDSSFSCISPYSKNIKFDDKKSSKARTSLLFSSDDELKKEEDSKDIQDNGLSPQTFYRPSLSPNKKSIPILPLIKSEILSNVNKIKSITQTYSNNKNKVFLCGRSKKRNSFGEINAGVRTGIKKPKLKRKLNRSLSKSHLLKEEAIKLLKENSTWSKKINSAKEIEKKYLRTTLPIEQIKEMDNLLKEVKNPPTLKGLKRSNSYLNEEDVQNHKIQKLEQTETVKNEEDSEEAKENLSSKARKFFKHRHSKDKTVNILQNITLKLENGKMKLQSKPIKNKIKPKETMRPFDTSDLSIEETSKIIQDKVENVLDKLNESITNENIESDNKMILSAHFSEVKHDNSIILHQPPTECEMKDISTENNFEAVQQQNAQLAKTVISKLNAGDIIMSPTSLMCDMTSGLALTSPKKQNITKAANLIDQLDSCPTKTELQKQKLFPIFVKGQRTSLLSTNNNTMNKMVTRSRRIWKTLDERQYQIDAGQKRWGMTQCPQCEVVYSQNEPEDEQRHLDFHNKVQYLRFNGWKNEKVVAIYNDSQARIIEITPADPKVWWKKVSDLLFVVDNELGYGQNGGIDQNCTKVYFYVKNRQVIGFLSAIPISEAYQMIPNDKVDCCTEQSYPVKCGISRIWVAGTYRRQKIATRLVDTLRKTFILGCNLNLNDFAFSVPSVNGKIFAKSYTKTDKYLVYTNF